MNSRPANPISRHSAASRFALMAVIAAGVASTVVYSRIAYLSGYFGADGDKLARPIVTVVALFSLAFLLYLLALWFGRQLVDGFGTRLIIVLFAVAFRATLAVSIPIQEVDIYRYLWDGIVSQEGISPYRYAPAEVRGRQEEADAQLLRLQELIRDNDEIAKTLQRVHFAEIPTVYPPVSQWGFWWITKFIPTDATMQQRLIRMRFWLVLCDLATCLALMATLQRIGWHFSHTMTYAWCPLVVKEVANSGHLDSMTVLLVAIAIYCIARLWSAAATGKPARSVGALWVVAAAVMGLGVAGKIYPIVLAPWFCLATVKKLRWWSILPTSAFVLTTLATLHPMYRDVSDRHQLAERQQTSRSGLEMFYRYWEMNDFLFMVTVENLKPRLDEQPAAWFTWTPNSWRSTVTQTFADWTGYPPREAAFQLTRGITGCVFGTLVLILLYRVWFQEELEAWLRVAFLTLAWFWLLSPTQNPWYWMWALPMLPFAKCKSWLLISGLAMVYYLRFWFDYHYADTTLMGTPYRGTMFFDFVITWWEFAPFFLLLAVETWWRRRTTMPQMNLTNVPVSGARDR